MDVDQCYLVIVVCSHVFVFLAVVVMSVYCAVDAQHG